MVVQYSSLKGTGVSFERAVQVATKIENGCCSGKEEEKKLFNAHTHTLSTFYTKRREEEKKEEKVRHCRARV